MTTRDAAALVRQMRDALAAEPTRQWPYITRAISAADQWLAEQPTNQCGETCERAKLCATCARELSLPPQRLMPLTEEEVSKILLHCHAIPPGVSLVRLNGDIMDFVETMTAFARAVERARGIGQPANKPGAAE